MTITPTDKGALIAGATFWTLVWTILLKIDHIPGLGRFVKFANIRTWIEGHFALTLVGTEVINMSLHPPTTSPAAAMFAFGGTIVNTVVVSMIWLLGRFKSQAKFV